MESLTKVIEKIKNFKSNIELKEVNELDITCKSILKMYLNNLDGHDSSKTIKIQAVLDYMYEQVNIGNWKDVSPYIRKTITISSYLRLVAHLKSAVVDNLESHVKQSFKIIDFGIMFGCPLDADPNLLQNCASVLSGIRVKKYSVNCSTTSSEQIKSDIKYQNSFGATPLEVIECPSMETFYKNYIVPDKPVILSNCINHWPALKKWKDKNYFLKIAGLRTVSVEVGSKYTDSDWTQKLMTIEEFIDKHIYQSYGPIGYLAQYQLFDQIPELKNDIVEPEYCCFSECNETVDINAWYGPKGTVSPLHHDPKKNLLAQVLGEKQVFLFSQSDTEYLYPHDNELLNNTARVDPRQPDFDAYPKYRAAKPYYGILHPGQMLYIPPKWWHFIESLSISFSVSFWWS